jgi:dipeptidyl-peptidase-4
VKQSQSKTVETCVTSENASVDCKPCQRHSGGLARLASIFCLAGLLGLQAFSGGALGAEDKPGRKPTTSVPELTLETLYHPTKKFDFDGDLPTTHWVGDAPSKLLIRRKKTWNEVDADSGAERSWPVVDQLTRQLSRLEGLKQGQARSAAMDAVPKLKSASETVLIKIGKSLAAVSAQEPGRWLTRDATGWRNPQLDPTRRRLAFTRDGNLFVVDANSGRSMQLTSDGSDTLLNGVLDWTYQEEIFGRGKYRGFWFSPDGAWLAMLRIDISGIEPYFLPSAASDRGAGVVRRYPKAGDPIPHAGLHLWDLTQFDSGVVPPPKLIEQSTAERERIITGVWWAPHRPALLYCVSDRLQTWRELRVAAEQFLDGTGRDSELIMREESPAWIEPPDPPTWLSDGSLVWCSDLPLGRKRLYHVSVDGQLVTPISPQQLDVRDFMVRTDRSFAVVTGDVDRGTIERHAYRIDLKNQADEPQLVPITKQAGWHSTSVSPDGRWIVDRFSTPTEPPQLILRSTRGNRHRVLAESKLSLQEGLIAPKIFHIPTADGIKLPAMLIRPKSASSDRPAAVVIEVYGGPQAPVVSSRWSGTKSLYRQLLARRGIATLIVDNRSSAGRGVADTWSIRGRVGELEFNDLETAVSWLQSREWVDSRRIAIRGWSFGGFLTLYAMTHSDAFAAGIAGGPVTDWREYDAFYTERYMGLPSENLEGYRSTSPLAKADKLQGRLLLIHGEADDNVHPSGTMRMAEALQKAGKDFQMMIYPGAAHHVSDRQQAWHMVQMTDRFLMHELAKDAGNGGKNGEK